MSGDDRRRRWVPLDVDFYADNGRALYERFGMAGPVVWTAFLTACQRSTVQGQLRYHSDAEALAAMGLSGYDIPFGLSEFFAWTGQQKWTRQTRRRGAQDARNVAARRWAEWQPRAHRLSGLGPDPQASTPKRGATTAQIGRNKGATRAELGRLPDLTQPGGTPVKGVPPPPGNAPSGSSASRPSGRVATETTRMPVNGGEPPPVATDANPADAPPTPPRPDPPVPAAFTAALDAIAGRLRQPTPPNLEAERARQLAALTPLLDEHQTSQHSDTDPAEHG